MKSGALVVLAEYQSAVTFLRGKNNVDVFKLNSSLQMGIGTR